jgi:hypothetical protein
VRCEEARRVRLIKGSLEVSDCCRMWLIEEGKQQLPFKLWCIFGV